MNGEQDVKKSMFPFIPQLPLDLEGNFKELQSLQDVLTSLLRPSIEKAVDERMGAVKGSRDDSPVASASPEAYIVKNLPTYERKIYSYLSSQRHSLQQISDRRGSWNWFEEQSLHHCPNKAGEAQTSRRDEGGTQNP